MADVALSSAAGAAAGAPAGPMGAIAGAGIGLLGSLATSAFNAYEQGKNRDTSIDLANTSHQREVADLKAAGLNPLLSVNKGATTPSFQAPQVDNPIPQAMQSALFASQLKSAAADSLLKQVQANTELQTQSGNIDAKNMANLASSAKNSADYNFAWENSKESWRQNQTNTKLLQQKLQMLNLELPGLENQAQFQKGLGGKLEPWMSVVPGLNSALGAAKYFAP